MYNHWERIFVIDLFLLHLLSLKWEMFPRLVVSYGYRSRTIKGLFDVYLFLYFDLIISFS